MAGCATEFSKMMIQSASYKIELDFTQQLLMPLFVI